MKKALILISCCLLIAVVALCVVWNNLNGQKAILSEQLEMSENSLKTAADEAAGLESGKSAAEALAG